MSLKTPFERQPVIDIVSALKQGLPFIHIMTGPRQVGKTTCAQQVAEKWPGEVIWCVADTPVAPEPTWIQTQWETAISQRKSRKKLLLIFDEVQKVPGWSESIKFLWDREKRQKNGISVLLLGSSALLMQQGMTESLAGRFILYRCPHWTYAEMKAAFKYSLNDWIFYGGYPGTARLKKNFESWSQYINDSLVETVLSKDVIHMASVNKPMLLRHLFAFACGYPAQIFSYNKMLGQLQDAGNTTTLAHYVKLMESCFLISGLEQYKLRKANAKSSSPKLVLWNNALISSQYGKPLSQCLADKSWWGRLVENAVGAHIINQLPHLQYQLYYWREADREIDFVLKTPRNLWALEVKTGPEGHPQGFAPFMKLHPHARPLIIGHGGLALEDFFTTDLKKLFG